MGRAARGGRSTARLSASACSAAPPPPEGPPTRASPSAALPPAARKPGKGRLDAQLLLQYPQYSRSLVQSWIIQGKVLVGGVPVTKPGTGVHPDAAIEITAEDPRFVCRAGYKLEAALEGFGLSVAGLTALDSGLSSGGFTDCLLQRGAARVYGVDVGYGQVHERIRTDARVVVMERTNLRHLRALPEPVDVATLDLSFISALKCLPAVRAVLKPGGRVRERGCEPPHSGPRGRIGCRP